MDASDLEQHFEHDASFASAENAFWTDQTSTKHRLFHRVKDATTIYCEDCFAPHKPIKSSNGEFGISCPAGTRLVAKEHLQRWRIDPVDLIGCLRTILALTGSAEQRLEGRLWYIGDFRNDQHLIPIWLMRACGEPEDIEFIRANLQKRSPDKPGVIISSNALSISIPWPRGSKILRLCDALSIVDNQIQFDQSALHSRLPNSVKAIRNVGRPLKGQFDYETHFAARAERNEANPNSLRAEAQALRHLSVTQFGEDQACAVGHIENLIRADYRAWKSTYQSQKST